MGTLWIVLIGFAIWMTCLGIAKLAAGRKVPAFIVATNIFIVLWLLLAAINMWIGVTQAGYSFMDELPIFLVIFLVPSVIAYFSQRRFLVR